MKLISCFFLSLLAITSALSQRIESLGPNINSEYDELNPVLSQDNKYMFFVRKNHPQNKFGKQDSEDIWVSEANKRGDWSPAKPVRSLNISRYNSVLAISRDDKRVLLNGVFNENGTKFVKRGLSISTRTGDNWGIPVPLPIKGIATMNRGINTTGTWNQDETVIILSFSTDYMGEENDLFIIQKTEKGWSSPQRIKSLDHDKSSKEAPFLSEDGKKLFFSWNKADSAKFDIYYAERKGEGWLDWTEPQLAPFAINSEAWDSHLEIDSNEDWAYICSTHHNSRGGFDIFRLDLKNRPQETMLHVRVLDIQTKKLVAHETYNVLMNGKVIEDDERIHPDSCAFKLKIKTRETYSMLVEVPGYTTQAQDIEVEYEPKDVIFWAKKNEVVPTDSLVSIASGALDKDKVKVIEEDKNYQNEKQNAVKVKDTETGAELTEKFNKETGNLEALVFNDILFEFDRARLLDESRPNLEFLLRYLQNNKNTKVTVDGFTSAEGTYSHNKKLSQKRAGAIVNYLRKNGVDRKRMQARGFGPENPIGDNNTKEGRKANRRVEVNILK